MKLKKNSKMVLF